MGIFGKSFEEEVQRALQTVRGRFPGSQIDAQVGKDVVTLTGRTTDVETKTQIMAAFNAAVETKNTINQIQVDKPLPQAAGASPFNHSIGGNIGTTTASEPRFHDVASGDTLSALAKKYYGEASKYSRIFEANRDQLNDPDRIKVGQRLRIPT